MPAKRRIGFRRCLHIALSYLRPDESLSKLRTLPARRHNRAIFLDEGLGERRKNIDNPLGRPA